MPYEQGLSDWRVYSAEQAVGHDRNLSLDECQHIVDQATASAWWRDWFPNTLPIDVVGGGDESPELDLRSSFAAPHGSYIRPTQWTISLHSKMQTARVLLHELAHCVQPRYIVEEIKNPGRRRGVHDAMLRRKHLTHGDCFTAALAVITDKMLPADDGQLAKAFAHYESPIAPRAELLEQLAGQPAILDDEEAFWDDITEHTEKLRAKHLEEHGEALKEVIPPPHWGFNLHIMRRDRRRRVDGRMMSMKHVAEAISKVMPCSSRHISALEHSRDRPDDPSQLKRAMLIAIFLGIDPIWTRYNLRLTRWDCGEITMNEARLMNPSWADLVDHLNQMLQEMPPRWAVEGAR